MRHRLFFLLLLGLGFWLIPPSHACQIMAQPESIDFDAAVDIASTVLVGRVTNIRYEDFWLLILEIEVEQYLKGEGLAIIEIMAHCASYADLGNRYIFFLNPFDEESYSISISLGFETTSPATAENIAAVRALTGQSLPPQQLPLLMQLERFTKKYPQYLAGTAFGILAIAGIFWFIRHKPTGKRKMKREEML